MRKIILSAWTLALAAVAGTAQPQATRPPERSLLWEVSGNGLSKPCYLFGTYHLMTDAWLDSVPGLKKCYSISQTIVTEAILDSSKMMQLAFTMMMRDSTLSQLLTPEQAARLDDTLNKWLGISIKQVDNFKPQVTQVMLLKAMAENIVPEHLLKGQEMDTYFMNYAKTNRKTLVGLETMQYQANLLFNMSTPRRQAAMLMYMIDSMEETKEKFRMMTVDYMNARLDKLDSLSKTGNDAFTDEELEILLYRRNENWMQQLPGIFKTGPTFVAVGALHLTGKEGLVTKFRNLGYTVKPLND